MEREGIKQFHQFPSFHRGKHCIVFRKATPHQFSRFLRGVSYDYFGFVGSYNLDGIVNLQNLNSGSTLLQKFALYSKLLTTGNKWSKSPYIAVNFLYGRNTHTRTPPKSSPYRWMHSQAIPHSLVCTQESMSKTSSTKGIHCLALATKR